MKKFLCSLLIFSACQSADQALFGGFVTDSNTECHSRKPCETVKKPHCSDAGECVADGTTQPDCDRFAERGAPVLRGQSCQPCQRNSDCRSGVCWRDSGASASAGLPTPGSCLPAKAVTYVSATGSVSCPPAGVEDKQKVSSVKQALEAGADIIRLCPSEQPYGAVTIDRSAGPSVRLIGEDRDCDVDGKPCATLTRLTVSGGNVTLSDLQVRPGTGETGITCSGGELRMIRSVVATAASTIQTAMDINNLAHTGVLIEGSCKAVLDQSHVHAFSSRGIAVQAGNLTLTNTLISGVGEQAGTCALCTEAPGNGTIQLSFSSIADSQFELRCTMNSLHNYSFLSFFTGKMGGPQFPGCPMTLPGQSATIPTMGNACGWQKQRSECMNALQDQQLCPSGTGETALDHLANRDYKDVSRQLAGCMNGAGTCYRPGFLNCYPAK